MNFEEFKRRVEAKEVAEANRAYFQEAEGGRLRFPTVETRSESSKGKLKDTEDEEAEEEEYERDTTQQLLLAHSLLTTAMHHLGFYGDPKLSGGKITKTDAKIMMSTAEEIKQFLEKLEEDGYTE